MTWYAKIVTIHHDFFGPQIAVFRFFSAPSVQNGLINKKLLIRFYKRSRWDGKISKSYWDSLSSAKQFLTLFCNKAYDYCQIWTIRFRNFFKTYMSKAQGDIEAVLILSILSVNWQSKNFSPVCQSTKKYQFVNAWTKRGYPHWLQTN